MDELILERPTIGEVLEHEPNLQQSPGLVPDGIDESLQPARLRLGRRLAEQYWRGHLAVLPTLFNVRGKAPWRAAAHSRRRSSSPGTHILPGATERSRRHLPAGIDRRDREWRWLAETALWPYASAARWKILVFLSPCLPSLARPRKKGVRPPRP